MSETTPPPTTDVVVVGGGPSGLSAAIELRRRGIEHVVVLERDTEAGGIPRHTMHTGFGMRDRHRIMSGPKYAALLRDEATAAGIDIRTSTTATGWSGPTALSIADERGTANIEARAVVLATGVRERPRAARLVPGDRGGGIYTTGALQRITALHHL